MLVLGASSNFFDHALAVFTLFAVLSPVQRKFALAQSLVLTVPSSTSAGYVLHHTDVPSDADAVNIVTPLVLLTSLQS